MKRETFRALEKVIEHVEKAEKSDYENRLKGGHVAKDHVWLDARKVKQWLAAHQPDRE